MVPIAGAGFLPANRAIYEITDLRVQFKVEKNLRKEPNTAEVKITNLSPRSRVNFQQLGVAFVLQAGYETTLSTVFVGDVRIANSAQEGPDWITTLQAGDGERAYAHPRVNDSFRAGTDKIAVVKKIAGAFGLDVGNLDKQISKYLGGQRHETGYVARGRASSELDRALRAAGLDYSIQDGKLQVLKPGEATTELAVEVTPESGLIGSPQMCSPTKKGKKATIKFRSLLQPSVKPGGRVVVGSAAYRGTVLVEQVTHAGDTRGQDWYSDVEGTPV